MSNTKLKTNPGENEPGEAQNAVFVDGLVRQYNDALVNLIQRKLPEDEDAEDVAQEVYIRLAQKPDVGKIENRKAFLFRAARNLIVDIIRRRRVYHRDDHLPLKEDIYVSEEAGAERVIAGRQELERFQEILQHLPRKCRKVYILHRFNDMTYSEIAAHCGITTSAVEKHMIRAIAYINSKMGEFQ